MLQVMFPNQNILANICLTIPVATASVERSFSQMKMIKTRFSITQSNGGKVVIPSDKILIELSEKLSDSDLENIVDVWNRKNRRIVV